jgi:hypothetical protein
MAAWPAKPAASDVVAHATAERALATRASSVSPVETAVNSSRNLRENLMDLSTLFSLWSRLVDTERLTPRGGPRRRAVVGAVRER